MTHAEILQLLYDETLVGNAPAVIDGVNDGLAQGLERPATELWELVEEEDAVMGEAHLSRPSETGTAADQPGQGDGMVRRPEGAPPLQRAGSRQLPEHAPDLGQLQRLLRPGA